MHSGSLYQCHKTGVVLSIACTSTIWNRHCQLSFTASLKLLCEWNFMYCVSL